MCTVSLHTCWCFFLNQPLVDHPLCAALFHHSWSTLRSSCPLWICGTFHVASRFAVNMSVFTSSVCLFNGLVPLVHRRHEVKGIILCGSNWRNRENGISHFVLGSFLSAFTLRESRTYSSFSNECFQVHNPIQSAIRVHTWDVFRFQRCSYQAYCGSTAEMCGCTCIVQQWRHSRVSTAGTLDSVN